MVSMPSHKIVHDRFEKIWALVLAANVEMKAAVSGLTIRNRNVFAL